MITYCRQHPGYPNSPTPCARCELEREDRWYVDVDDAAELLGSTRSEALYQAHTDAWRVRAEGGEALYALADVRRSAARRLEASSGR